MLGSSHWCLAKTSKYVFQLSRKLRHGIRRVSKYILVFFLFHQPHCLRCDSQLPRGQGGARIQRATPTQGVSTQLHTPRGASRSHPKARQAGPPTTLAQATLTDVRVDFSSRTTSVEVAPPLGTPLRTRDLSIYVSAAMAHWGDDGATRWRLHLMRTCLCLHHLFVSSWTRSCTKRSATRVTRVTRHSSTSSAPNNYILRRHSF